MTQDAHTHHHHGDHADGSCGHAQTHTDPGEGSVTDPVCGMSVTPGPQARSRDYDGQTFYFCSHGCQSKFDADPYFYAFGNAGKVEKADF